MKTKTVKIVKDRWSDELTLEIRFRGFKENLAIREHENNQSV